MGDIAVSAVRSITNKGSVAIFESTASRRSGIRQDFEGGRCGSLPGEQPPLGP